MGVIPVMKDIHQQIGIGCRQRIDEEVTRLGSKPLMLNIERIDYGRQVKQHAFGARRDLNYSTEQEPAPTANVGDRAKATEIKNIENRGDVNTCSGAHPLRED